MLKYIYINKKYTCFFKNSYVEATPLKIWVSVFPLLQSIYDF